MVLCYLIAYLFFIAFLFFSTHSPFGILSLVLCLTLTHSLHLATPSHSLLWCTSFSGYPTLSVYPHFSRSLPLPSTTQTVLFSSSRNSLLPSTLKQMAVSVLCCNGIVPVFALHVERVKAINFAFVSSLRLVAMLIVIACIQCIIYPLNYFWISLAYKALRYIHKYILTATTNTHLPFHYRQPFQTYWLNPRNARISHKTKRGRSRHFILNEYSAVLKIPCEAVLVKSDSSSESHNRWPGWSAAPTCSHNTTQIHTAFGFEAKIPDKCNSAHF